MSRVATWLEEIGLADYAPLFAENDLDWDLLPELENQDLVDIGIASLGHRKRILKAIAELSAQAAPASDKPAAPAGERRQITVMFCDLVGSTELSTRMDAEDVDAVIRRYQERVTPIVHRYGGHVARFAGDGILSYFGYPNALEREAERAIHTALEVASEIARAELHPGVKSSVRIGIATGDVVIGGLYDSGRLYEAMATGETPNLAARLQSFAEPGGIAVCETTRRLAGPIFEYRDEGLHNLRGFRDGVPVFSVQRVARPEHSASLLAEGAARPLEGREAELETLQGAFRKARTGKGVTVLLRGEAGVGKTRLVQAFLARTTPSDAGHVRLTCQPYYQSTPFHAVTDLLGREAGIRFDDPAGARRERLEAFTREHPETLGANVAVLAQLLGIATPEDQASLAGLSPQRLREDTIDTIARFVLGKALDEPLVVQLEDAHWADASTLQFLEVLAARTASLPVLLLVSARRGFALDWADEAAVQRLDLGGLPGEVVLRMIERIAGGNPLPPAICDQIIDKADGIPLYVEELTKSMVEEIWHSGAGAVTEVHFEHFSVPDALQNTLMARIDRLGEVKDLALHCAVIGREFEREMLALVVDRKPADISRALKQLVDSGVIEPIHSATMVGYAFRHALIRDAAYNNLLKGRRREIHLRVAKTLEDHYPQRVGAHPEQLAQHLTLGGDAARAIPAWIEAGTQALMASANVEAVEHLRQGLELVDRIEDPATRMQHELRLQMTLGPALIATKGFAAPEVKQAFDRAREICEAMGNVEQLFPVLRGLMAFYTVRADFDLALGIGRELGRAVEARPSSGREIEWRWNTAAALLFTGELEEAQAHLDAAVALYDPVEHASHKHVFGQDPGIAALAHLAIVLNQRGQFARARECEAKVLALIEAVSHPFSRAQGNAFVDSCAALRGEFQRLLERSARSRDYAREQGFAIWQGQGMLNQGLARVYCGDPEGAGEAERGFALRATTGSLIANVAYMALVAETCLVSGAWERGLEWVEQGLEHARTHGERNGVAELLAARARLRLAMDAQAHAEAAERDFRASLEAGREIGALNSELRTALAWALYEAEAGRPGPGFEALAGVAGQLEDEQDVPTLDIAREMLAGAAAPAD